MKKILILSGLSLLVALAVRAQDKVTEYNVRPAVAVRTPLRVTVSILLGRSSRPTLC